VQLVFEEARFRKPFFVTWYGVALLVVYLPFYPRRVRALCAALSDEYCGGRHHRRQRGKYALVAAPPPLAQRESRESVEGSAVAWPSGEGSSGAAGEGAALMVAVRLGGLFVAYQLAFNIGLELANVSTVTILSASSGLWTLLFSTIQLHEPLSLVKLLATLVTFGGVVLVALTSNDELPTTTRSHHHHPALGSPLPSEHPQWGDGAALFSAMVYGLYAANIKRCVPSEAVLPMPYLFGLIGLFATLLGLPTIAIAHTLRLERFTLPSHSTLAALTLNGILGSVLSNMLLARAMLLASPLVATVGLSLSIPLAIAADAMRGRGHFAEAAPLLGTAAVWAGFVGVSLAEQCAGLEARLWRCIGVAHQPARVAAAAPQAVPPVRRRR
jgi:drug/metabolite transporter (DMT)-like permease